MKTGHKLFISGLLCFTSCIFLVGSQNVGVANAGTTYPYQSAWNATKLLYVTSTVNTWGTLHIPLGVAEWKVTGTYQDSVGTHGFKEIWDVPGVSPTTDITLSLVADGTHPINATGVPANILSKWSYGMVTGRGGSHAGTALFTTGPVTNAPVAGQQNVYASGNGAIQCEDYGDTNCLYASGSYGYTWAESIGEGRGSSQVDAGGLMQPLQWTINGFVCDDSHDTSCQ